MSTVFLSASCIFFLSFPFFPLLLLFLSTRKYGRATRAPSPGAGGRAPKAPRGKRGKSWEGHSLTRKSPQSSLRRESIPFSRRRATPLTPSSSPFSAPRAENATPSSASHREQMRGRRRSERSGDGSFPSLSRLSPPPFAAHGLSLASSLSLSPHQNNNNPQDYVRARLVQFAGAFASAACPQLGPADVRAAAAAAIARLPPPLLGDGRGAGGASGERAGPRELQLVFRHDCLCVVSGLNRKQGKREKR